MHIDDWLDNNSLETQLSATPAERYARFFLEVARMPATKKMLYGEFVDRVVTCEYEGKRYRLTGASRLGDVWLNENMNAADGYTLRVDVAKCAGWKVEG
jgi:hypothetical protein